MNVEYKDFNSGKLSINMNILEPIKMVIWIGYQTQDTVQDSSFTPSISIENLPGYNTIETVDDLKNVPNQLKAKYVGNINM